MIIYNVTSQVAPEVLEQWIVWMQDFFIPKVLESTYFKEVHVLKVHLDENSDPTYAIQYKSDSEELIQNYLVERATQDKEEIRKRFGDQVLFFETRLELISTHK
jgi:hypothetical protein